LVLGQPGWIVAINHQKQRGTIRGKDGRFHRFCRDDMVRWLEFDELTSGDLVLYDLETTGSAVNVERAPLRPA
jgi:hypothetical protein